MPFCVIEPIASPLNHVNNKNHSNDMLFKAVDSLGIDALTCENKRSLDPHAI